MEPIENLTEMQYLLVTALKDYRYTNRAKDSSIDRLVDRVNGITDLTDYVQNLSDKQLGGKEPLFRIVHQPEEQSAVRLDMYWDPKNKQLTVDWDD